METSVHNEERSWGPTRWWSQAPVVPGKVFHKNLGSQGLKFQIKWKGMASLKASALWIMKQEQTLKYLKIRIQKIDITEDHTLLGVLSLGGVQAHR